MGQRQEPDSVCYYVPMKLYFCVPLGLSLVIQVIAGSLESANSSVLAAHRLFKEVVGNKIRILC